MFREKLLEPESPHEAEVWKMPVKPMVEGTSYSWPHGACEVEILLNIDLSFFSPHIFVVGDGFSRSVFLVFVFVDFFELCLWQGLTLYSGTQYLVQTGLKQ